jgi:hypothetical protein
MSTLKNLYISQSYQGLIHLGTNQSITGSSGYIPFQDGLGHWISASIDNNGNLYVANDVSSSTITTNNGFVANDLVVSGNLIVHDDIEFRGNVDVTGSVRITENLFVSGTIHAYEVITTVESSSVIFSSGSNVIGDSTSDTQTIVGQTSISGSLTLRGTQTNTGSLFVSNEISSSTINGIGNVTTYSASVDSRLDYLEGPFSTSVDNRLDLIEFFTSSEETKNITLASYTGSNDTKWSTLTNVTQSVLSFTSSQEAKDLTLATYTGSNDTKWSTLGNYTQSVDTKFSTLATYTGSLDTKNVTLGNYTASLITAFTASGANVTFNGNINVLNQISSSTLNGMGNVTAFSQSVDLRLDQLEAFSSSLVGDFVTQNELAAATGSLINSIATKLNTSSFEAYTGSQDSKNLTLASYTGSIDTKFTTLGTYTSSNDTKWSTLGSYTGSLLTTGSNIFVGNQIITGSLILSSSATTELTVIGNSTFNGSNTFSGSVQGSVTALVITSNTASLNCSVGNFFTLSLVSGSSTHINATNLTKGQTTTLKILQPSVGFGAISFNSYFKFPNGTQPLATQNTASVDVLNFVTFDNTTLYTIYANNLK